MEALEAAADAAPPPQPGTKLPGFVSAGVVQSGKEAENEQRQPASKNPGTSSQREGGSSRVCQGFLSMRSGYGLAYVRMICLAVYAADIDTYF